MAQVGRMQPQHSQPPLSQRERGVPKSTETYGLQTEENKQENRVGTTQGHLTEAHVTVKWIPKHWPHVAGQTVPFPSKWAGTMAVTYAFGTGVCLKINCVCSGEKEMPI